MNRLLIPILLIVAACQQASPSASEPPLAGARTGGPFSLIDQDGRTFTDRSLLGRYAIVYFGYTFCPDVCPTDMGAIAAGLKQVEKDDPATAAKVVPVFITVDPARDTPAVLKQFVRAFHPRAVGLTGSSEAIAAAAKAYAVPFGRAEGTKDGYLVDHARVAYLMGPDGKPLALAGADGGPAEVARTIERWVK